MELDNNNQTIVEQNNNCDVGISHDTKKKKSDKRIFITAIATGLVMIALLYSFVGSLIEHIIEVNNGVDRIIATTVLIEENVPSNFIERYKLYKEFNQFESWDYEKYVGPVLKKAYESAISSCDNYHVSLSTPINLHGDGQLSLPCRTEIYVDGNIARGIINVSFYDSNKIEYDEEKNKTGKYYEENVEFYRVLENDKITTYMSLDGESWFKKDGLMLNDNNVMFDIKALINKLDAQDASWFPTYYTNDDGNFITFDVETFPYNGIVVNSNVLYYSCDSWGEINVTLHKDSYLPCMVASGRATVDEIKLGEYFADTNDLVLEKMCESDLTLWPIYKFDQYGEVDVSLPDNLSSATEVNNFSELFVDLYEAIDTYTIDSEWR